MEWTALNERMIQVRFFSKYIKLTIIHVYMTMLEAYEEVKDEFSSRLQEVADKMNQHDMLIITGDMNAKVGDQTWDL